MEKGKTVTYHSELQAIADYLNRILFSDKDYIKNSFSFICGLKGDRLVIDVVEIDYSLPNHKQVLILELMDAIVNDNNKTIEEMFKNIISKKTFPKPTSSYNSF